MNLNKRLTMVKFIFFLYLIFLSSSFALGGETCFVAKENGKTLKLQGECNQRYAPESTFKIGLSLMGFDSGILIDENIPSWSFKQEYKPLINVCKGDHSPQTWMRDSCVWYSRVLTNKLGKKKFDEYVKLFNYGNRDTSGDAGINNGLTHSWISSSLQISPDQEPGSI